MFGIKIISKKEYKQLIDFNNRWGRIHIEDGKRINDCDSLRQQLNDQMAECRKLKDANDNLREFKRDTLEALANIDLGSFRLKVCGSKCDTCDNESTDCHKYIFGSHTFCVIPKQ